MPKKSSNSVGVTFVDAHLIKRQLKKAAENLKQDLNVVKVLLFGSLVRGNYGPSSDADICILLKEDSRKILDRIPDFLDYFLEVDIGVDVFPYTLEEFARMEKSGNFFIREIIKTGMEL